MLRKSILLLTFRTETEKIQSMGGYSIPCFLSHFFSEFIHTDQIRIHDLLAFRADHMGVGDRVIPVVSVTPIGKAQFQHFIQFLEKGYGLVNRGQARGRKIHLNLLIYIVHAWMSLAYGKYPENGQTLGSDAKLSALQLGKHHINPLREFCWIVLIHQWPSLKIMFI